MSFLKRLFGLGGGGGEEAPVEGEKAEYKGYAIQSTPFKAEGQYQTAGVITREIDGEVKEHRFIRADRFPTADVASEVAIRKARQMIDQQGDRIFD